MKFDQTTTTIDLLAAAQMERYQDMLREAEIARLLKEAGPEQATTATGLIQRLRQWVSPPAAEQPLTASGLKCV